MAKVKKNNSKLQESKMKFSTRTVTTIVICLAMLISFSSIFASTQDTLYEVFSALNSGKVTGTEIIDIVTAVKEDIFSFGGSTSDDWSVGGNLNVNGNATLGDAASDTLTFTGQPTFNATTTLDTSTTYTLSISSSYTATSVTAVDNVELGSYTNTGSSKICRNPYYDLQIGSIFESSFSLGTTTATGDSWTATNTATLIASTTIAASDNSELRVPYSAIASVRYPGTFWGATAGVSIVTSTEFYLNNGVAIVASWNPYGATSSNSFTAAGGSSEIGSIKIDCRNR